jgi:transposase
MRLTEYGRNPHMRKAYVQQPDFLIVGVDVRNAKHHACLGTQRGISRRKLAFTHTREGIERFEQTLKQPLVKNACRHVRIAMEPSGISWQALYDRLQGCGDGVCLVHCQAVRNNRKTMQEGTRKTDEKDADRVFDLLRQGKFFLPVERDPALQAAYRLMPRSMALKKRISQLRTQLRAAIPLAFPARNPLVQDLTQPTAVRFLHTHPTPESLLRHGRPSFLAQWQPRHRCGQWRPETFHRLYDLATASIGLRAPYRIDECERMTLANDRVDALTKQPWWLDKAIALLAHRADYQLLVPLPRIGQPTAAAILTAIGNMHADQNGTQLVKLAGLDIRLFESGSSIRKLPNISHGGRASLRDWRSHSALRLIAHAPHFRAYSQRRKHQSPGKGAGQRALIAVCDNPLRMLSRILTDHVPYTPQKDQSIAAYYAAQQHAA